MLMHLARPGQ